MKHGTAVINVLAMICACASVVLAQGANSRPGKVIVPDTNIEHATDIGVRAHTNYRIFVPAEKQFTGTSPSGETPGSIGCIYEIDNGSSGCPTGTTALPSGGGGVIAVVDAYDYPTAANDFNTFSQAFGLPSGSTSCHGGPCFTKVSATGTKPHANSGWALEAALDIEWTHAMAPNAQIVLVEAASSQFSDLLYAVNVASNIVTTCNGTCASSGKGEVSMSWGGSEFSGETAFDQYFTATGVVYTAASGDSGGSPIWPSTSPYVVSCGGTTINRDRTGSFTTETAWSDSGGGDSVYEAVPSYQLVISNQVGDFRGTPDFSFDADPNSGVSVYDSTSYQGLKGWLVIGGTSASAQGLAGVINLAGSFAANSTDELGTIYGAYSNTGSYQNDFRDITSGSTSCSTHGHHASTGCYAATKGWDFLTGVGSNLGKSGK